jgi:hypothetical protein
MVWNRVVDEAQPGASDVLFRDDGVKGFGPKVTPKGAKSYFLEWRLPGGRGSPKGRIVIDKHGSPWTPDTVNKRHGRTLRKAQLIA